MLLLSLIVFFVLAIVVAVGGLKDIRSLFAEIDAQHGASEDRPAE